MTRAWVPVAVFAVAVVAADEPYDLIRAGNDAARRGDPAAAAKLYAAAEERAADPGLVAFNTAAALAARGEHRAAELHYLRALDDKAIPPGRQTRATFDRGVCLVRRGADVAGLRSAIACFEQTARSPAADDALRADARHNLELAKLLWNQARARQANPPKPSELPPEDLPDTAPPPTAGADDPGPDAEPDAGRVPPGGADPSAPRPSTGNPLAAPQQAPGAGQLPVLPDADDLKPMTPEDARAYLERLVARVAKDRKDGAALKTGPERPGVRDW